MLRNKLGIADSKEMDRVEAEAQIKATDALSHEYDADQLDADDICAMCGWVIFTNGLDNIEASI